MPPQYLVMLVVALLVTPPFVLLIPHARQSPAFDRLLWLATFALAFLGAWIAFDNLGPLAPTVSVGGVPLLPIAIGAVAAGLALNLILFLLDYFERPEGMEPEEVESEESEPEEVEPPEVEPEAVATEVNAPENAESPTAEQDKGDGQEKL